MPNKICVMPSIVERLREDYKKGELNLGKLAKLTDQELNDFWKEKYGFGDTLAKYFTSRIQQAVISPKVAQSLRTVLRKDILNRGKLYSNISLDNAKALSQKYTIQQLSEMNREERTKALAPYLGKATDSLEKKERAALDIAKRIEQAAKQNKLNDIAGRLFGEYAPSNNKVDKQLKKVMDLAHNELLNPQSAKEYMRSLVEAQMGIALDEDEAKNIYKMSQDTAEKYKATGGKLVVTATDPKEAAKQQKAIEDYFVARADLERYTQFLQTDTTAQKIADEAVSIVSAGYLASIKSLFNSAKYQISPSLIGFFSKKSALRMSFKSIDQIDIVDNLELNDGNKYDLDLKNFFKHQIKLAFSIYDKTGEDIARMNGEYDDTILFSQNSKAWAPVLFDKEGRAERKKKLEERRQIELENSKNKTLTKLKQKTIDRYNNYMAIFPKWFAGTTDVLVANATRAHTSLVYADMISKREEQQGKLPKGMTQEQRRNQLVVDSYSLDTPTDGRAAFIKAVAIQDANVCNNTQDSYLAEKLIKTRNLMNSKNIKWGNILSPFVRISATTIEQGVKTATSPLYIPYSYLTKFTKIDDNASLSVQDKAIQKRNLINDYIRWGGGFLAGALWALFADMFKEDEDDLDYVSPYDMMKGQDYVLARAAGANPGSIKLMGKWVSLTDLGVLGNVLMGIKEAEKILETDGSYLDALYRYGQSQLYYLMTSPVVSDIFEVGDKVMNSLKKGDTVEALKELTGTKTTEQILRNGAQLTLGSFFGRDVLNVFFPPEQKYDFLGNPIKKSQSDNPFEQVLTYYLGIRDDTQTDVFSEFNRLYHTGNMPTISEPDSLDSAEKLAAVMPSKEYTEFVQQVKREYGKQVGELIKTNSYKRMNDAEKKKAIDGIRNKLMKNKNNEFAIKLKSLTR